MLTRNAIGNLINRYKAVLKKCHILNTFGTLAVPILMTGALMTAPQLATSAYAQGSVNEIIERITSQSSTVTDSAAVTYYEEIILVQRGGTAPPSDTYTFTVTAKDAVGADVILYFAVKEAGSLVPATGRVTGTTQTYAQNIINNTHTSNGGGMYNDTSAGNITLTLTGDIIGNTNDSSTRGGGGGGMYNEASNSNTLTLNITGDIIGNTSTNASGNYDVAGGGMYNKANGGNINLTLAGDIIGNTNKTYNGGGGGMYNEGLSGSTLTLNITGDIIGNTSDYGGGIYNRTSADGNYDTTKTGHINLSS